MLNKRAAVATALPNLTVQQLEYLVAVVDERTWADAAAAVGAGNLGMYLKVTTAAAATETAPSR